MTQNEGAITVVLEAVRVERVGTQDITTPIVRTFVNTDGDIQEVADWLTGNGYIEKHGEGEVFST